MALKEGFAKSSKRSDIIDTVHALAVLDGAFLKHFTGFCRNLVINKVIPVTDNYVYT